MSRARDFRTLALIVGVIISVRMSPPPNLPQVQRSFLPDRKIYDQLLLGLTHAIAFHRAIGPTSPPFPVQAFVITC